MLQKTTGLVRIGEVGRCHDHVFHLFGQLREYCGRGGTRGTVSLLSDGTPVNCRQFTGEPFAFLLSQLRVGSCPLLQFGILLCNNHLQFFFSFLIEFSDLREDGERTLRITTQILDCLSKISTSSTEGLTMCGDLTLVRSTVGSKCPFAHHGITNDQRRFFFLSFCLSECLADL